MQRDSSYALLGVLELEQAVDDIHVHASAKTVLLQSSSIEKESHKRAGKGGNSHIHKFSDKVYKMQIKAYS